MTSLEGKVAAITGAASGIGRALAVQLAAGGARLAIADVNASGLEETAEAIREAGGHATRHLVDVSSRAAVHAFADEVVREHGGVQIVVNNAGVALGNVTVQQLDYDDLEWVLGVNLWGVIHGTKAFLPHLLTQPHANLVNMSSIYGLAAIAKGAAYSASKFAVRGFSEALRQELLGTSVALTVVFPGGIRTNIARNTRPATGGERSADPESVIRLWEGRARTTADEAAGRIIQGIARNAPRVVIGADARVLDLVTRFRPGGYDRLMLKHVVINQEPAEEES